MRTAFLTALGLLVIGNFAFAGTEKNDPAKTGQSEPQILGSSSLGFTSNVPSSKLRLIDPSRLQHWNELVFSFDNSGRDSFQGLYLSTFGYQLANPLDLSVTLGARFAGDSVFSDSNQGSFFLSNLRLRYQPNESTLIMFQYQDPRGMTPYYWHPYSYWR